MSLLDTNAVYLIWSNEHKAWWCANSRGYSHFIESAGRYTREQAVEISRMANRGFYKGENPEEIPVLEADAIEAMQSTEKPPSRCHLVDEDEQEELDRILDDGWHHDSDMEAR